MNTIRYTPLCGVSSNDSVCGVLEVADCRILLDCGWTESGDESCIQAIARIVPHVDAIIISHGDIRHAGALPVLAAMGALPVALPIISTMPVRTVGRLTSTELLVEKRASSHFNAYASLHISMVYDAKRWTVGRFYQQLKLTGRAKDLIVTPFCSGHTLGGAVWRITTKTGDEIMYAMDWCHMKERHLGPCLLSELCSRPAALITDCQAALLPTSDFKARDSQLVDLLLATLRGSDGSVLLVMDTTSRLLELALALDAMWAKEKFDRVYPLVAISPVARQLFGAAYSMIEYMADTVYKTFEMRRENPLAFRCLRTLTSTSQLTQLQPGPKVVLAGSSSLDLGPARQLLLDWAQEERHTIILTERPQVGTTAMQLADLISSKPPGSPSPPTLNITHTRKIYLEGEELEAFLTGKSISAGLGPEGMDIDTNLADGAMAPPVGAVPSLVLPASMTGLASVPVTPGPATRTSSILSPAASLAPSGTVLRNNTARLSSLTRDAAGHAIQQLTTPMHTPAPGINTISRAASLGGASRANSTPAGSDRNSAALVVASATQQIAGGGGDSTDAFGAAYNQTGVLMDGFVAPQDAAFPMFPDEDEGVPQEQWDAYGVVIDHGVFKEASAALTAFTIKSQQVQGPSAGFVKHAMKRDVKLEEEEDDDYLGPMRGTAHVRIKGENGGGDTAMASESDTDEDDDDDEEDRPSKLVTEQVEVQVRAAVRYLNYDGRSDRLYVRRALVEIAPQNVVLLHGSDAARQDLRQYLDEELQGFKTRVYAPAGEETCGLSVPGSYVVAVSGSLHALRKPHALGNSKQEGAVLDAVISGPVQYPYNPEYFQLVPGNLTGTLSHGAGMAQQGGLNGLGSGDVDMLPSTRSGIPQETAGWVGDVFFSGGQEGLQLSHLLRVLQAAGIQARWLGKGALACSYPGQSTPTIIISKASVYASARAALAGGAADADHLAGSGRGHVVIEAAVTELDVAPDKLADGAVKQQEGSAGSRQQTPAPADEGQQQRKDQQTLLQRVRNVVYAQFGAVV